MAFRKWKQILIFAIVAWLFLLGYLDLTDILSCGPELNQIQRTKRVLDKSQYVIEKLQTEIKTLRVRVASLQTNCKKTGLPPKNFTKTLQASDNLEPASSKIETTEIYKYKSAELRDSTNEGKTADIQLELLGLNFEIEKTRRRASKELREMWYYLSAEVTKINKLVGNSIKSRLTAMLDNFADIHRALTNNLDKINNHGPLITWRQEQQSKLSEIVQNRLSRLQNPKDCNSARKLICDLNKGCGYGCQMHHLLYCFITAYGTKRTLIIQSETWRYSDKGWNSVFFPASNTCTVAQGPVTVWSKDSDSKLNVQLPIIDAVYPQPKHLPLAVPKDLATKIQLFHAFPFVWWIGQFAKYLFRYQPGFKKEMNERKTKLGFKAPIVGVHVRRTDKINVEAAYHSVEEYMYWVELYYKKLSMKKNIAQKNVYLASDDVTVLPEAKKKYPSYNFISDADISKSARVQERYTDASLHGIIFDIQMLSESDYIVCTFSSQVCRIAYEIMQANSLTDASEKIQSLDDVYYFGGQMVNDVQAVYSYSTRTYGQINLEPRDRIQIAGNHWDGYSKGTSRVNKKLGMFPSYLVEKYVHTVNFPDYSDFDKELEALEGQS